MAQEKGFKTLAIRLDDGLHARLTVVANLEDTSITDVMRRAIEGYVNRYGSGPDAEARAKAMLAEIDREAEARKAAIETLFRPPEQAAAAEQTGGKARGARHGSDEPSS